jgi:hypothetical protein
MGSTSRLAKLYCVTTLSLAGCGEIVDPAATTTIRDREIREIQREAGAPVSIEIGEAGDTRILAMTPRFPVPGHAADPAIGARDFLVTHHDAFQLDAADAAGSSSSHASMSNQGST